MRSQSRLALIHAVRRRLRRQVARRRAEPDHIDEIAQRLDPNALTIGFARRFTGYKRPNLLLQDPARLTRLLAARDRPVQLILAGKAHPNDEEGRGIVPADRAPSAYTPRFVPMHPEALTPLEANQILWRE